MRQGRTPKKRSRTKQVLQVLPDPAPDSAEAAGMASFAATFVDEIAAVQHEGGEAVVREKLASLSDDQRRVLREALSASACA